MKLLICTENTEDKFTFTLDLAQNLLDYGVEIILAVFGLTLSERQKKELEPYDYYWAEYKMEWMSNPWKHVNLTGKWLRKIEAQTKPDIIHLNSYSLGALPWEIPVLLTAHSCLISQWMTLSAEPVPWHLSRYRQMVQRGLRNADAVIAPSNSMLNTIEKIYGPLKNSRVIWHGKNLHSYHTDVKEKYIFSTGEIWDEARNIKLLLDAARKIDYPIYISGKNDKITKKNVPENVFFTGFLDVSKRADWLANAFIFLLPSRYEPFGYPFLEAAFSKCTLIGGDIESLREIWQDAMSYVKNTGNVVEKVNELMENPELMYLNGQKAYEHARENYTLNKMVKHYFQLYNGLLSYSRRKKQIKRMI